MYKSLVFRVYETDGKHILLAATKIVNS